MARQFTQALAAEFPEVIELQNLLNLAAFTWPKYGISANELSQMDEWTKLVLQVLVR